MYILYVEQAGSQAHITILLKGERVMAIKYYKYETARKDADLAEGKLGEKFVVLKYESGVYDYELASNVRGTARKLVVTS